jgi:hypothetical protein
MDVLKCVEFGKNELNEKINNLLKEMQILESNILEKFETISVVSTTMDSYHNAISTHINEVLFFIFNLIL